MVHSDLSAIFHSSAIRYLNHLINNAWTKTLNNFRQLVANQLVCHNPSLGTFTVKGTNGTPHAVKLFPSESCSCPATSRCYHIIAAQLSIGLANPGVQKKVNLTQLRRNMRSRSERKSGRKAPRPGDYEVIPAPDSTASQQVCVWEGQ